MNAEGSQEPVEKVVYGPADNEEAGVRTIVAAPATRFNGGLVVVIAAVALGLVQIIGAIGVIIVQKDSAKDQRHVAEKTTEKLDTIHKDTNATLSDAKGDLTKALARIEIVDEKLTASQEALNRALGQLDALAAPVKKPPLDPGDGG